MTGKDLVTTDAYIEKALSQYSITDKFIDDLKENYKGLTSISIQDKEGYSVLADAIKTLTGYRSQVTKKHKELKAIPLKIGRAIDGKKRELIGALEAIEQPLKEHKQSIDEEHERQRMARFEKRTTSLFEIGCAFNGQFYVLGTFNVSVQDVHELDDADFNERLGDAELAAEQKRIEDEKRAAEQAELERLRKLEAEQKAKDEAAKKQDGGAYQPNTPINTPPPPPPPVPPQQPQRAPIPQPISKVHTQHDDYREGFEACRQRVLAILNSPDKFTRKELRDKISKL